VKKKKKLPREKNFAGMPVNEIEWSFNMFAKSECQDSEV